MEDQIIIAHMQERIEANKASILRLKEENAAFEKMLSKIKKRGKKN